LSTGKRVQFYTLFLFELGEFAIWHPSLTYKRDMTLLSRQNPLYQTRLCRPSSPFQCHIKMPTAALSGKSRSRESSWSLWVVFHQCYFVFLCISFSSMFILKSFGCNA